MGNVEAMIIYYHNIIYYKELKLEQDHARLYDGKPTSAVVLRVHNRGLDWKPKTN